MADRRKNNGGHSTKSRKATDKRKLTKAERLGFQDILNEALPNEDIKEIVIALAKEAKEGSEKHARLLFEYVYGRPTQSVDMTTGGESLNQPRKILFEDMTK